MKIELAELKRITARSEQINTDLTGQFTQMTSTLEEIVQNVQSDELSTSNKALVDAINEIAKLIPQNLSMITEFLNTQLSSYEATNVSAKEQIDSLVNSVNSTFTN